MASEMQSIVKLSEPEGAYDGCINLHLLQCGHHVFVGVSQYTPAASSNTNAQYSVAVWGTYCKTRSGDRHFLCKICLLELAANSYNHLYDEAVHR